MSKKHPLLVFALLLAAFVCPAQKKDGTKEPRDQAPVFESKYFSFYNNINLNTHLFLFEKATHCKLHKTKKDSIALVGAAHTDTPLTEEEMDLVKKSVLFYRDSIIKKDLMTDLDLQAFADLLVQKDPAKEKMSPWQKKVWKKVDAFKILYLKIHSRMFNRQVADWIMYTKNDFVAIEDSVILQMQKTYTAKPFKEKIRVDLTNYAGMGPAFSYKTNFPRIILDVTQKYNLKEAGVENVFVHTAYLMADSLISDLKKIQVERKKSDPTVNPRVIIEYSTGITLNRQYTRLSKNYIPAYAKENYADMIPFCKTTLDALERYWPAYIQGKTPQLETLEKIVAYVRGN